MSAPKALILRAPGINCERETYDAHERAGANSEYLHIKKLLAQPELLIKDALKNDRGTTKKSGGFFTKIFRGKK